MTEAQLSQKAAKIAVESYPLPSGDSLSHQLQLRVAKRDGYKTGYKDAQSEMKQHAIAFAEWMDENMYERNSIGNWIGSAGVISSTQNLYDLFIESESKKHD